MLPGPQARVAPAARAKAAADLRKTPILQTARLAEQRGDLKGLRGPQVRYHGGQYAGVRWFVGAASSGVDCAVLLSLARLPAALHSIVVESGSPPAPPRIRGRRPSLQHPAGSARTTSRLQWRPSSSRWGSSCQVPMCMCVQLCCGHTSRTAAQLVRVLALPICRSWRRSKRQAWRTGASLCYLRTAGGKVSGCCDGAAPVCADCDAACCLLEHGACCCIGFVKLGAVRCSADGEPGRLHFPPCDLGPYTVTTLTFCSASGSRRRAVDAPAGAAAAAAGASRLVGGVCIWSELVGAGVCSLDRWRGSCTAVDAAP